MTKGANGRVTIREYRESDTWPQFASAVSLHAHTHHSREIMGDLPRYLARIPLVAVKFQREVQAQQRQGRAIDFSKGWWHPPVSPQTVFESEAKQIGARFGLSPLVSVTDHDDITAGMELQTLYANRRAPVSFEWTVPWGQGYFHLGVHNLPPDTASGWYARLNAFTNGLSVERIGDLLADLQAQPQVLIVFCHPLWDLASVGEAEHTHQLAAFMTAHRGCLHAIELNGYRSRQENAAACELAASFRLPLISGGDRHGRSPNALLNLTAARTFQEFVAEVRDGVSHVLIMPEYLQNLIARKLATASDVLRTHSSQQAGRSHWTDRVSWERDGRVRPLSFHWPRGGPFWVRSSVAAFQLIASPVVLPVLGAALNTMEGVRES